MAKPKKVESRYLITGEMENCEPVIVEAKEPGWEKAREAVRKYREEARKTNFAMKYRLWREVEFF